MKNHQMMPVQAKKARSIRPNLILLDLLLPELDGFAVCEILRRDPKTASIPIIILTAVSSQLSRLTGLDAGANAYLTKPVSPKYLLQCIQELLPEFPETAYYPDRETNHKQKSGQASPVSASADPTCCQLPGPIGPFGR